MEPTRLFHGGGGGNMSRSFARGVVRTFTTIAVLLVTGGLPARIAAIAQETAAEDKVVLTVGTTEDMVTDNPWFACCAEYEMLNMTYDKLLEFNTDDMTASPGLAEECTPSADYMTWTCNLRSGFKWSARTPQRHDHHLEGRGAPLRPARPAVGVHRPREGVGAVRRRRQEDDQGRRQHADDRERPVHARGVGGRPVLADGEEPVLLGRGTGGRRGRVQDLFEPGGDGPGAQERRDRHRQRDKPPRPRAARGIPRHKGPRHPVRLVAEPRLQLRRPGPRRPQPPRAPGHYGSRGDRARDQQAGSRRLRVSGNGGGGGP